VPAAAAVSASYSRLTMTYDSDIISAITVQLTFIVIIIIIIIISHLYSAYYRKKNIGATVKIKNKNYYKT